MTPNWIPFNTNPDAPLYIPASVAKTGETVTTKCTLDGIGLARLVDGIVYVSCGNGDYHRGDRDVFPIEFYANDNGAFYLEKVRRLTGWKV